MGRRGLPVLTLTIALPLNFRCPCGDRVSSESYLQVTFGTANGNPAYQPTVWASMRRLAHEMRHLMLRLIIRALVWEGYADFHLS